jgi:N-acetylmuramic acid 6-phosphate etherase
LEFSANSGRLSATFAVEGFQFAGGAGGENALKGRGKKPQLTRLATEQVNAASPELDLKSSIQIAQTINTEDAKVATAVRAALPQVAQAIDLIADAIGHGGRLIYVGAGTSGRIAALDAAECAPTFNTDPKTVQFVIAGGSKALSAAVEAHEDSRELGVRELAKRKPRKNDVVVGIAASGRTPFTVAALEYARRHGAKTIAVTCNPNSPLEHASDLAIVAEVGPEVISGSTRMKAGTAQKMILNMLSSGAMVRLGYVYGNLMANVHVKNRKLTARAINILERATGVSSDRARKALTSAANQGPVALVMLTANVNRQAAGKALKEAHGHIRRAIASALSRKTS